MPKTHQLQIRITANQKARLKQLARAAGTDVSSYVLDRALSPANLRAASAVSALRRGSDRAFALAELGEALRSAPDEQLPDILQRNTVRRLSRFDQNYVAAMLETSYAARHMPAPRWLAEVQPLSEPWFATGLPSVRTHLLRDSPVAFRRRNLFVDATLNDRI